MTLLLIGTGAMAREYSKALSSKKVPFDVIGKSQEGITSFELQTGQKVWGSDLASYLEGNLPANAIVCSSIQSLSLITAQLISAGVTDILVEKPISTREHELLALAQLAEERKSSVFIALNRRHYKSVQFARNLARSAHEPFELRFTFNERISKIPFDRHPDEVLSHWVIANSIHAIDAAFFIGGWPSELNAQVSGELSWHPSGKVFSGFGTLAGGPSTFSYKADWSQDGNWGITLVLKDSIIEFNPLENALQRGSARNEAQLTVKERPTNGIKPGLTGLINDFLHKRENLVNIHTYLENFRILKRIGNYG